MYTQFFNLKQPPFSIAPDPRYLFMTEGHREALAHLMFGVDSGGGLVLLTGEVGAGKTTVCRCFLEQVPARCNVAYIFNPKLTVDELLQTVCDEFHIRVEPHAGGRATVKDYIDALTGYLLSAHAEGRNNVLIIDEAQNLSAEVLEQLRLLTNLETSERKLLQIILIGQPELRAVLARPDLRQLAQRVIARYHLKELSERETASYIHHRLLIAGLTAAPPFRENTIRRIHQLTQGVPRRINLLCDRALLGAYAEGKHEVDRGIVDKAAAEVFGRAAGSSRPTRRRYAAAAVFGFAGVAVAGVAALTLHGGMTLPVMKAATPMPVVNALADSGAASRSVSPEPARQAELAPDGLVEDASKPATSEQVLSEHDGATRAGMRNESEAYRQLARLWGVELQDGDSCARALESNLHCFKSGNGFADLRQLDRPAILTLRDNAGKTYYVLLTGFDDGYVTIQSGGASQKVSLVILTRYFGGEFATFWRAPQSHRGHLEYGDKGPQVAWVAQQLARLGGDGMPAGEQLFDRQMVKQVREFQLSQGLRVDGVVGPMTLMHLNRAAGVQEPRLKGGTPANSGMPIPQTAAKE